MSKFENEVILFMGRLPESCESWLKQSDTAQRKIVAEKIFQISKISPGHDPLVICSCSKQSAQRFLAAMATQEGPEKYRISAVFWNPVLPGFEGMAR